MIHAKIVCYFNINAMDLYSSIARNEPENVDSNVNPPFYIAGTVVEGDKRGSSLGFPTLNLQTQSILIPHGVYVSLVRFEQSVLKGVAHIGAPKTFNISETRCEVHLFDFNGSLYDKRVELNLLHYLREVKKFENEAQLIAQIERDVNLAKNFLKNL